MQHRRHDFAKTGQCYERIVELQPVVDIGDKVLMTSGQVLETTVRVFDANLMWEAAMEAMRADHMALVDSLETSEGHSL